MSGLESEALVEFHVLFDVEMAVEILNADVVDIEVVASRDGADAVEDVLRSLGTRQWLHRYIGVLEDAMDRGRDRFD